MQTIIENKIKGIRQKETNVWSAISKSAFNYRENGHRFIQEVEKDSFWYIHRNRCVLEHLRKNKVDWILDVGGGNGIISELLIQNNIQSILLEPGFDGVCSAKQKHLPYIIHGSIDDCDIQDNSMNNAGLFDILEHIEKDDELLKKAYRFIVPGGRLFITVPAYNFLWSNNDKAVGHFRRYTAGNLERKLRLQGFTIEFTSYLFWILPLPILFFRKVIYKNKIQGKKHFEHATRNKFLSRLISFLLLIEFFCISKSIPIPFGSTCFIIARK